MLQAVMCNPGAIEFNEVAIPEMKENQVLIKMMRIGICGSDIHVYHGKHPFTSYPVVQGHEVSGEIVKVGSEVSHLIEGDKVTVQPQVVCGECYNCRHGRYHICNQLRVMGFQTMGMSSEYFAADAEKVLKLPEGLNFEEGAMIEPLAVAVHALSRGGDLKGKKVLVLGAGTVGNLVGQAAKGMGAEKVMITDLSDYRLGVAKECGIDYCVNPSVDHLQQKIDEVFGTDKMDVILECVGVNPTMNQAIEYARKGTDIIVVGVFGEKAAIDLGLVQDRELRLIGTLMYIEQDWLSAIDLVKEKKIKFDPLISKTFEFKNFIKGYEYIEEKKDKVMKVLIAVNS
ncbi:alcohol dehydrogenase catalytic domain-containing protein [Petroclostridium sp. X23]|uniref:zinc-dependent alcohol dehydrogenase n=1 Tax=Petroclostridium sp. X23 TaxID=3045146 RepID=UPI0024ADD218|nr:alcohol dehydrogenase catalytic domain-containing protein [Petroclostridium sp. X23]WHH58511.1 alcohol dehydrogenase catalytic domain-containing protein [Petroclostridium sp. X23]